MLGDGSELGMRLSYAEQPRPDGIAQAFLIGADFLGRDPVALILGDNIFYGQGLSSRLRAADLRRGATVFAYPVHDPRPYGVVELDDAGNAVAIAEKPDRPRSTPVVRPEERRVGKEGGGTGRVW